MTREEEALRRSNLARLRALPEELDEEGIDYAAIGREARKARGRKLTEEEKARILDELEGETR